MSTSAPMLNRKKQAKFFLLIVLIALCPAAGMAAELCTIEDVFMFPEQFLEQTMTFTNIRLLGEVSRDGELFLIGVRSEKGKNVYGSLSGDGFAFIVAESIADQLVDMLEPGTRYPASITAAMKTYRGSYRQYYVAQVSSIQLLDQLGERFIGETLIFNNVRADGEIERSKDVFTLGVYSETGKRVSPFLSSEGFTFVISENLASQLVDFLNPRSRYPVNLTVTMKPYQGTYSKYTVAEVASIDFLDSLENTFTTISERAYEAAEPPTIERVYLFPEQFAAQTLVFEQVELDGEVRRRDDIFSLRVGSLGGKSVSPSLLSSGFTFVVSRHLPLNWPQFWSPTRDTLPILRLF